MGPVYRCNDHRTSGNQAPDLACYGPLVAGTLFVVTTPLGNLEDLSKRAERVLGEVGCIACEDTRRTAKLLARYGLSTPTLSCHQFNELARIRPVIERLAAGEDFALVSDGGAPTLSDPGALLVAAAWEAGIRVVPIPGPTAPSALLSVSGLPADRWVCEGFLPHRAGERRRRLRELARETRTIVFFESPLRLRGTLEDIEAILGERLLVVGREMTKVHERIIRGTPGRLLELLDSTVRGEVTVAMAGLSSSVPQGSLDAAADRIREIWRAALAGNDGDPRRALRAAARQLELGRAELRRRLAELREIDD